MAKLIKSGDTTQMDIDQCKVLSSFLPNDDDVSFLGSNCSVSLILLLVTDAAYTSL